ncbi:tail fiber protein, partial [Escherichia coli]|uniref:phage tail fiber protein n=2 Tax=Escherichia coli TaxID=562 RepID=UPI00203251D1
TAAASSASAASTSAGQASASATAAGKSAESAASSASTATTKAGEATEQASAAARSASAAKTSETNAKASETSAESSKTAAASSASSAASSASSASASKDEATRQASAAKGSATTASTKATEAAGSATAASQSKTAAESAATRAEAAADRAEEIAGAVAMEDASLTTKGVVKLSSAVDSTSESLAATPKAVKTAYDNAEKRLQKDQNGADIPDKGRFLNNINVYSKGEVDQKKGMRYVVVNAPAGVQEGKYYPLVIKRNDSHRASRVVISTPSRTANHRMNNCEFNGFVCAGGWTDRGSYACGMFWAYSSSERAIHSILMSNKGDTVDSVFYIEGEAFPVEVFLEEGLSVTAPASDYVVAETTYKFGATDPYSESVAVNLILDFKQGNGFYSSYPVLSKSDISGNKVYANDEVIVRSQNALRMIAGDYGVIWRNDGANTYLLMTDKGDQYGGWNGLRPFAVNNATGEVTINTPLNSPKGVKGNSDTATKLQTARSIGGVGFDGSANINLPGVNTTGNQNTTGNAATATKLQTARTIGGVSFDGTANINLPGVNTTGNQNTTGNAATATKLQTARTINGVSFDGSANISLSPANIGCPASPTGWLTTGSNGGAITTAQLVTLLQNNGAFNTKSWIARCAWAYANSATIPNSETGCGVIPLAGAVIEVFNNGSSSNNYTIRITTATTASVSGALTNAEFIYVFNGTSYSPGWRRAYNTKNKPTAADVGALPLSGGALTGGLTSSGEIVSKYANGFRIAYGSFGFFIRNDGSNTYFMLTASGDTLGSWNGLRPITINNTSGAVSIGNGLNVTGGVNGSLNGNASTATKLQTARKISGVSFDGSADITLTAANVSAFARRATGTYADASGAVPWNAESGAYNVTRSGDSYIVANFYIGVGSCRTLQIRAHYKNGGLYYRSSRDGYGFEEDWTQIYTKKDSIPGVNADGNQNTTGNAATATKLQTARKIAGVAFDGSADITLTAANLNAYTKTEVTNLLSSYVKSSALPSMTVRTSSVSGGDMGMSLSAFISHLKSNGAFSKSYWIGFGDAMGFNAGSINNITGFGAVELAESIIEVFNLPNGDYTIRLTTSHKADYGGITNAILVYHYRSNRSPSGQWLKFAGTVGATSN